MKNRFRILFLFLLVILTVGSVDTIIQVLQSQNDNVVYASTDKSKTSKSQFNIQDIPQYSDQPYTVVNDNKPFFSRSDYTTKAFEKYSKLDRLKRCGVTYANICTEIMPTKERGKIGSVKPTGWHTVKYDCVDGKYLYNRCHLIGYQLSAENANKKNLITGTRYMNVEGMLPFENMVADYVKETKNHVLYRVTPIFEGDNLLASGVLMEAYSVEDEGDGISFCIYCYNVQPGVTIDYANGSSKLASDRGQTVDNKNKDTKKSTKKDSDKKESNKETIKKETFVLNKNTKKFHRTDCSSVKTIAKKNYSEYQGTAEEIMKDGYEPCKRCKPDK